MSRASTPTTKTNVIDQRGRGKLRGVAPGLSQRLPGPELVRYSRPHGIRDARGARQGGIRARAGVGARQGAGAKPVWLAVGLTSLLVVVATPAGMRWAVGRKAPVTIAVLPILNLTDNPGNDNFVDGLTDEIIRQASGITTFTVRSRTSSSALKGTPRTVREAASQLNVEYIVEGSLTGSGPHVRITAQLVRARDDVPLWAGRFDRQVTDILAIQQEISRWFVNALQLKLGRGLRRYDTEAFDLYLRARADGNVRFPGDDKVIGLFEQAISQRMRRTGAAGAGADG